MKIHCTTAIVLALSLMLDGCGRGDEESRAATPAAAATPHKDPLALTAQETRNAGVVVQQLQPAEREGSVSLTGSLTANQLRIANVLPQLAGRVVSAPVPAGASVRAGQTLATIQSIELGEAQSTYQQASSEAAVTRSALERSQRLAAEEIIATKDLQRARADAERAQAALQAAADKLRLLGASPGSAAKAVYAVAAPISGTVIDKRAVAGAHVDTSDLLFTVADLSTVWLEADAFEKDLSQLSVGAAASVSVAAYPERRFSGKLTFVSPTMDAASRTVKARIELPNGDGLLKPGMFATAQLASRLSARVLMVPGSAVTLMDGKTSVFVQTPAGGFEPRAVEGVTRPDGAVEIRGGVRAGEKVVVAGAYALKSRLLKSSMAKDD